MMNSNANISGKTVALISAAVLVSVIVIGGAVYILESRKEEKGSLVIYTYDSFVASWGIGPQVIPVFEEKYGINVTVISAGDVGNVIQKLEAEKKDPSADLVIGIDNSMLHHAIRLDLLDTYEPENISRVDPSLIFDPEFHLIPYDYGYIAIICNGGMMEKRNLSYPDSLLDLAKDEYRDQILLLDPATTSTGSSFMIWSAAVAGSEYPVFCRALARNARAVYGTWDSMYYTGYHGGEAPIAISYGLETAYEMLYSGTNNSVTVVPSDHGYRQIEGAGIVKGADNRESAELFLEFMLSDDFQEAVELNVMLPVVSGIDINEMYLEYGAYAEDHAEPDQDEILENYDSWMKSWDEAFA
ncbi:MAG: thiamine ABC transporter substrate binding subunit [Thermoplasmatota archaeon]